MIQHFIELSRSLVVSLGHAARPPNSLEELSDEWFDLLMRQATIAGDVEN